MPMAIVIAGPTLPFGHTIVQHSHEGVEDNVAWSCNAHRA